MTETLDQKVARLMALIDEAIQHSTRGESDNSTWTRNDLEAALRAELAPAVQGEPVAWQSAITGGVSAARLYFDKDEPLIPLGPIGIDQATPQPALAQPIKAVQITIDALRRAAKEIRDGHFSGWGNTCEDAATLLEHLSATPQPAQPASAVEPTAQQLTDAEIIDIRRKTTATTYGAWADSLAFARAAIAAASEVMPCQNKSMGPPRTHVQTEPNAGSHVESWGTAQSMLCIR